MEPRLLLGAGDWQATLNSSPTAAGEPDLVCGPDRSLRVILRLAGYGKMGRTRAEGRDLSW
jgi:hypothetical protein